MDQVAKGCSDGKAARGGGRVEGVGLSWAQPVEPDSVLKL